MEEHSIYVEAEMELNCFIYENKDINVIQDLYSPCEQLTFKKKEVKTMTGKKNFRSTCNMREKLPMPEVGNARICDVSVVPIMQNQTVLTDRVTYEGEVRLAFLLLENGSMQMQQKEVTLPFEFVVEEKRN